MAPRCPPEPNELLARLIGFDTTSRNSNLALIAFVRDHLDGLGVATDVLPDASGEKANLLATIGPPGRPGIVLSGHTDVVPVDGQAWSSDPFVAREQDGRLYGRGSTDMKGFLAIVLALVPELLERRLAAPVHLAFSYDEEVGCKGVPALIGRLIETAPVLPMGAVIGEPTAMRVVDGHKGKGGFACTVIGRAGHSALHHRAVNAIEVAGELVARLRRMAAGLRTHGPSGAGFEPAHGTVNVGTIEGGTALNIVAERCRFTFEFRTLPGQDPRALLDDLRRFATGELLPEMRDVAPEADIAFEELLCYPGLGPAEGAAITRIACEAAGTGPPAKAAFGTEAGHFALRGIPAVVCGPGDIALAHRPDEHIELAELERCRTFLRRLLERSVAA